MTGRIWLIAGPTASGKSALALTLAEAVGGEIVNADSMQLYARLRSGGTVGILPDQQPKAGDGVFAPFFGIPALTMTLLSRLAARTGAIVLFAWCERIGDGDAPAYALHVEAAPPGIADEDPEVAAAALNAKVEHIARRDPAQYQWTYKRYTLRPSGRGEDNPYRDLERRRR